MACVLLIISSNLSFNDDILSDSNLIRIDPTSVLKVAEAINKLYLDSELREK